MKISSSVNGGDHSDQTLERGSSVAVVSIICCSYDRAIR